MGRQLRASGGEKLQLWCWASHKPGEPSLRYAPPPHYPSAGLRAHRCATCRGHGRATSSSNESLFATNGSSRDGRRDRRRFEVRAPRPPKVGVGPGSGHQTTPLTRRVGSYSAGNALTGPAGAPYGPKREPHLEVKISRIVVGWTPGTRRDARSPKLRCKC